MELVSGVTEPGPEGGEDQSRVFTQILSFTEILFQRILAFDMEGHFQSNVLHIIISEAKPHGVPVARVRERQGYSPNLWALEMGRAPQRRRGASLRRGNPHPEALSLQSYSQELEMWTPPGQSIIRSTRI